MRNRQRYAIRACEELGEGYQPVARALKSELRALLLDYPQLPEMFLMDDTPTANLETQKWLRTKVLNSERLLSPLPNGHLSNGAGVYERALEAEGTFIAVNNRVSQSVPHLHIHIVPRRKGDGLKGFFWPRRKYDSEEHLRETAAKIRQAI